PSEATLPRSLYIASVIGEGVALIALILGHVVAGGAMVAVLALAGSAYSYLGSTRACGCLGRMITLTSAQHRLLAAAYGLLGGVTAMAFIKAGCRPQDEMRSRLR